MINKVISHFRILEEIGKGGMGIVYKAHDEKLDRIVALKFIASDYTVTDNQKKRFLQEAKAAAQLNHPNICNIHSMDEFEGQQFIEMEFIEGETLRHKMNHLNPMSLNTFRDYALQLADALVVAHQKGIIHRDIKPENIMVDKSGRIKIMDFGLAKLKGRQSYTNRESTLGTLTYMSPEQIRGENIDERSDIFSLGIIFYEMLTGTHPFNAEYRQALVFQIINNDPELPSLLREDLPVALEDIVVRCLQKDPNKRYRFADALKVELEREQRLLNTDIVPSRLMVKWKRLFSPFNLNNSRNLAAIGSAVMVVFLIGILWARPFSDHEETKVAIPVEKHIAVLPFNNLTPQNIPETLNEGIMEILTSHITGLELYEQSMWVIPSSEVRAGNITSVKEAAMLFGANLAVTGSLQHIDDQLLLTINLVDGNSMRQLRSVILEMNWNDQTHLQEEVIKKLTDMLEIELEPRAVQSITAGGTPATGAYQRYIEGQGYLSRYDEESIDKAIEIFHQTIEIDTEFVRAYAALAETYWRKYELTRDTQWADEAIKYGDRAINLMKQPISKVYITIALINNGMERYKDALGILGNLSEREQNSYQALIEQARAYDGLGQADQAEELYQQAIDSKRFYWDGHHTLGLFYTKQGRFQDAAEAFEKALERAPANARVHTNLAGIYQYLGRTDEAMDMLQQSLEIRPTYRALTNLGTMYFYQRDYLQAIRMYEQALQLNDTDRRIWGDLGYAYKQTGQDSAIVVSAMEKAIMLTEQELELTPNNQELLSELASYNLMVGNVEKCRRLVRSLTSLENMQSDTRISLISLFEQLGERDSALHWMEISLKEGDNIDVLETLEEMEDFLADPRVTELRKYYAQEITQ